MKKLIISVLTVSALVLGTGFGQPAHAAVNVFQNCDSNSSTAVCKATSDKLFGAGSVWSNILNTLIYATGAVSVLMIVIGGFRYSISGGDQSAINSAKNTILYAVIGLVLAVTGYAIVNFILTRI